jgi:2,4-dienoyl-CoA reductase-like NADH-dependent reductase (Old Yellow Enzyme family)
MLPNFHEPQSLDGWRRVVEGVHAAGAKIAPQLFHKGLVRKRGTGPNPDVASEGPSTLITNAEAIGNPMTESDIADTISAYAKAALAAKEIGFDAVELHGAHGYLIDQFFWEGINRRSDCYGGDLVRRTRFAGDIVRAIRASVGSDFAVILRFSQWKQQDYKAKLAPSPRELAQFLEPLTDAGVDIFHASTRRFWEPEFDGSPLNLAGWAKKLTGKPSITVGSVGLAGADFLASLHSDEVSGVSGISEVEGRIRQNEFDLVAVGRALVGDYNWVAKIREGRGAELIPFSPTSLKASLI